MKNLRLLQTFFRKPQLSLAELRRADMLLEEKTFVSIGGGIGSFCWVDILRIHGALRADIAVIAEGRSPYLQFKQHCERSGLAPTDRLRSDSGTRPDNFWGFPGYALDECFERLRAGQWRAAGQILWQILTEPLAADFYTPTAERIYTSIEREMRRIGWRTFVRLGTALFLRKLNDGRFAIFYEGPTKELRILVANFVHLALGHLVRRPDYLSTAPIPQVVSGYELAEDFFCTVAQTGGVIVVVGRGIVAARIVERLVSLPDSPATCKVISVFRQPLAEAAEPTRQQASWLGWRLQPFNWPRASFAGELAETFKRADPAKRQQLTATWSAASTPPRQKWLQLLKSAYQDQNYQVLYGRVTHIVQQESRLALTVALDSVPSYAIMTLAADYLVDCSGFDERVSQHFFYADLLNTYAIPLTSTGSVQVNANFAIEALASDLGQVFVTGSGAAGNHYGPMDSFWGHQYAARQSLERLATIPLTRLRKLDGLSSAYGWLQWVFNQPI